MPYDASPAGGGTPAPETPDSGGATFEVDRGALPRGMDFKTGDVVEFKVVSAEPGGPLTFEYNHSDGGEKEKDSFSRDMMAEMSPRNTDTESET